MESSMEILAQIKPQIVEKEKKKRKKKEKELFFIKPRAYKNTTTSEMKCPKGFKVCRCGKTPKCKKK